MKQKRKKIFIGFLIAAVTLVVAAGVYGFVFFYDAFGIVGDHLSWRGGENLPADMRVDESRSAAYTVAENGYLKAVISVERSPYLNKRTYIAESFDRFVRDPAWQAANGAAVLRDEEIGDCRALTVTVDALPEGMADTYVYVTRDVPGTRYFLRAMFKYDSARAEEAERAVAAFAADFRPRVTLEKKRLETDFAPVLPADWSRETRDAYDRLCAAKEPYFGVYSRDVGAVEERLDHDFALALTYIQLSEPLPLDKLEAWYAQGKLTELTLQCTVNNNSDLCAPSPMLGILRGEYDGVLASLADGLAAFGRPVLFRFNNEMNSDWTSYSGAVNLSDPDLFVAVWRYIYDFFESRGVHNLIWVWNPNDRDFPPAGWNSFLAYYPGNGYVHMLGVTGYNTGTYYKDVTGEDWRDFDEIYEDIEEKYGAIFGDFPWMITEFASSSVGGDKPGWIRDMFRELPRYGRIKAAVWFDQADYDESKPDRPEARPYWIAETDETLAAFKEGIRDKAERFFD